MEEIVEQGLHAVGILQPAYRFQSGISAKRETLPCMVTCHRIGKYRRGRYVFITWKGDHRPRHVQVYRDGTLIVKWDLDNQKPMKGAATSRIPALIAELDAEGLL